MQSHWKGGSKTNFTGRQHDHFCRKPDGFNNKATEFSKVVKYQINILKSIIYILTMNNQKFKFIASDIIHACMHACRLSCFSRAQPLRSCELQPLRLLCPWNSPGKNTGVGCHALLNIIQNSVKKS